MVYHWRSYNAKLGSVDDMVLLPQITEDAIVENLRKRFFDDNIFTSIGPVLISVNPFKKMPYFGEKEIEAYQGAAAYENPPHIYGLADEMFRNLLIDVESQCVIISGESGAGKTVAARYIMDYIARVSGGTSSVQHVKDVVLNSNPLLEAFGNAKTVRNNNSSRFGRYVELVFEAAGQPEGGRISNFLLEKSRVTNLTHGERSFHIFYQLCEGSHSSLKDNLGLSNVKSFQYLSKGGSYSVEGLNDAKDFLVTQEALKIIEFSEGEQRDVWNVVAAILHIGNINFVEDGNYAHVSDKAALEWPAFLLGIDKDLIEKKLVSRRFEGKWGAQEDSVNVTLNLEQAIYTRDALAKGLYAKLFDYLVQRVNAAMFTDKKGNNIGILDIYGFEILEKNGFEQFCINFVNEKLQQIFIQLTLKAEQEEYVLEGIAWSQIDYFNNKIVCDLIEGRSPPGLFLILDDVCATLHAITDNADKDLHKKLNSSVGSHIHYSPTSEGFLIKHYAGTVSYSIEGFCDRNRDVFFPDLVQLLQTSSSQLIHDLYPIPAVHPGQTKTRPTTAGFKIRSQAGELVARLSQCVPHYVRCIKPNENKCALDWDNLRVKHQVEYLGLRENICVRRAGFAYRRPFIKFLNRYSILTLKTRPLWKGDEKFGVKYICESAELSDKTDFQLGKSKVFVKNPESLFHLEALREQQYNKYARVIQRAFKRHFACRQQDIQRQEAAALVFGKKERRRFSINRHFVGDYIGLNDHPDIQSVIGRREKLVFALAVLKFDRRFKASSRCLILTSRSFFLIGWEPAPGGGKTTPLQPVVKRNIPFPNISHVTLSTLQDDFVVVHVKNDFDSLLEVPLKTEFLSVLAKKYLTQTGRRISINFSNSVEFSVKKTGLGGGGTRHVVFVPTITGTDKASLRVNGSTLTIGIGSGLPAETHLNTAIISRKRRGIQKHNISVFSLPPAPTRAAPPPPNQSNPVSSTISRLIENHPAKQKYDDSSQKNNNEVSKIKDLHPNFNSSLYPRTKNSVDLKNTSVREIKNFNSDLTCTLRQIKNKNHSKESPEKNINGIQASVHGTATKPIPGGGRPRPQIKSNSKEVKALYDYCAQDTDEISFKEGEIFNLLKEHPGGWWQGKIKGKEGLFPANYVEKL